MKLHHIQYKKNYREFLLELIEEDYNNEPLATDQDKIKFLKNRFTTEYGFMVERVGEHKAVSEWLSGLAIPIPFYNGEIVELAVKMGSIEENPSEALQSRVIQNYWTFMANIIITQLFNKEVK